ncbi:MAG: LuxR C-terminal-related transcriptional regulator [Myxococcota bacterium]
MIRPPNATDVLDLLEVAYRPHSDVGQWLRCISEAVHERFDVGGGVHGYFFDLGHGSYAARDPLLVGSSPEWQQAWRESWWKPFSSALNTRDGRWLHQTGACWFTSEVWGELCARSETFSERVEQVWGDTYAEAIDAEPDPPSSGIYPDSFNLVGVDASQRGFAMTVNMPAMNEQALTPSLHAVWERVVAHLIASLRLQAPSVQEAISASDAICDARGRLLHATGGTELGEQRALVTEATRRVDTVRSRRMDVDTSTTMWRAMTAGRWTISPTTDTDGKLLYLARPNVPEARHEPIGLSAREAQTATLVAHGHSNKLIAYELGLSESTVGAHLRSARAKLGASSRRALIEMLRNPAGEVPTGSRISFEGLTRAQRDVLKLWSRGASVDEIAAARGCSRRTVDKHIENAYRALGVHSRAELVARLEPSTRGE